jgi:hypothetical protein
MPENFRNRHRHFREQPGCVDEGQLVVVERRRVHGEHERLAALRQDAKVAAIRRVARERDDARVGDMMTVEIAVDGRRQSRVRHGRAV